MLKIGLTGGIGSGKSTVARIFEVLNIPVYRADLEARRLMQEDASLRRSIQELMGDQAYQPDGLLNRSYIAAKVFSNADILDQLNALVHPKTIADSESWASRQTSPYVIKEAALMFESSSFHYLDFVIGVSAPLALRVLRCMKRDHSSRDAILKRIRAQMDEDLKLKLCDFVLTNDDQSLVIPQVLTLHRHFLSLNPTSSTST